MAASGIDLREHDTAAVLLSVRIEGRTVQTILPIDTGRDRVGGQRAIVLGTGEQWRLSVLDEAGQPGDPQPVDAPGLRGWVVDAVSSLADAVRKVS